MFVYTTKEAKEAVKWMYGFTEPQAKAYLSCCKVSALEEIIKAFRCQSKMSFEND